MLKAVFVKKNKRALAVDAYMYGATHNPLTLCFGEGFIFHCLSETGLYSRQVTIPERDLMVPERALMVPERALIVPERALIVPERALIEQIWYFIS